MPGGRIISGRLHETAFREFLQVTGLVKRAMEPYFAQFGISAAQWGTLRTLRRREEAHQPPPRLTELSEQLLIRPPSVCGVVDRLERLGLVSRHPDAGDQRSRCVELTGAGRRLVDRVLTGHSGWIGSIMAGLSAPEQAEFLRLLRKFADHVRRPPGAGAPPGSRAGGPGASA